MHVYVCWAHRNSEFIWSAAARAVVNMYVLCEWQWQWSWSWLCYSLSLFSFSFYHHFFSTLVLIYIQPYISFYLLAVIVLLLCSRFLSLSLSRMVRCVFDRSVLGSTQFSSAWFGSIGFYVLARSLFYVCELCKEGIKAPAIRHFKVIAHDATDGLTSTN